MIRLDQGAGRARRPVLTARKVHFEIDLLGMEWPLFSLMSYPRINKTCKHIQRDCDNYFVIAQGVGQEAKIGRPSRAFEIA